MKHLLLDGVDNLPSFLLLTACGKKLWKKAGLIQHHKPEKQFLMLIFCGESVVEFMNDIMHWVLCLEERF